MTVHGVSEERVDRLMQALPGCAAARTRARRRSSSSPGLPRSAAELVANTSDRPAWYAPSAPTELAWRRALNDELRRQLGYAKGANAIRYDLELRVEAIGDGLKLLRGQAAGWSTLGVLTTPGGLRRPRLAGG